MSTHRIPTHPSAATLLTLCVAAFAGVHPAGAQPAGARAPGDLAAELARLRGDVERISEDVDERKRTQRARLQALEARRTELGLELQRERLRRTQLEAERDRLTADVARRAEAQQALVPAVKAGVAALRGAIAQGIPFQQAARTAALDDTARQLDEGLITPVEAVGRVWGVVEDELRMARENGLFRQVVTLDGEEVLADVARLGTALIYFRTHDNRVGHAVPEANGWVWRELRDPEDRKRVDGLFDALRKQIRAGWFELPVALPPTVSG